MKSTGQPGYALSAEAGVVIAKAAEAVASAVAAAASAATSLNAIAQAYKGGVAGGSVPSTSTAAGDHYSITAIGSSHGKTWAIGDQAIYNGSSGQWTQVPSFYVYEATAGTSAGVATAQADIATTQAGIATAQAVIATTQVGLATTQAGLATTNGAAQVALATAQAVAAAGSATTALNAIAQSFKGGIAASALPATSPLAGDYYRITTAGGPFHSKTWALGDAAIYNGSSGSWTQLTGWFAYADGVGMVVASFAGGYPFSDGATSNRAAGIYGPYDATNNPREWVAGAASLTIPFIMVVPTSAVDARICTYSSNGVADAFGTAGVLQIYIEAGSGVLQIWQSGATTGDYRRQQTSSSFRAAYGGQTVFGKVELVAGTADLVLKINGTSIALATQVTAGTPPNWLASTLVPTYRTSGYNWPSGPAPIVTPILGATSAADDAFYMQTGKWPAWVVAGGSAVELITDSNTRTFTSTAGLWLPDGGGSVTASGGVGVFTGASQYYTSSGILSNTAPATQSGVAYLITLDLIENLSAQTVSVFIGDNSLVFTSALGVKTGVVYSFAGSRLNLVLGGFSSSTFKVDNFSIKRLGALSLPVVQPINVIDDVSGIGGNQGRLLGCSPVTDKTAWRISANTWTSGNQQILAGSILDSTKHIIDQVEQSTTGTPTTTIGSASAGSQYKASGALTAGINPTTLVTRKLASNDVWVNSNSTAVVRTTITGHLAT